MPSGWQNGPIVATQIIIYGTQGAILIYSPFPGAGNLIGSWASNGGTDSYGNSYPAGLSVDQGVISGTLIQLVSGSGLLAVYNGPPDSGDLIGSWSSSAGTDPYGNSYPAGLAITNASGQQVVGQFSQQSTFNVTTAISDTLEAVLQLVSEDANETIPGLLGALSLAGTKMATLLSSPFSETSEGACLVLESENDSATDTPVITLGVNTTPDNTTLNYTPIMTLTPYALLVYGGGASVTQQTLTGSGTWENPDPAVITSVRCQAWAAGAGSYNGAGGATPGGRGGGGGGAYAEEPDLAVGASCAYVVGQGGAAAAGGNTSFQGSSVEVLAEGGGLPGSGQTPGTGGAAGSNTIANAGGNGAAGNSNTSGSDVTNTQTWSASHTYTYEGSNTDSDPPPGYTPLARINVDGNAYQGDDQLGDNGNTCTLILWPWEDIQDACSGYTSVNYVKIKLSNLHSWYDSGMTIAWGWSEDAVTSFGDTRDLSGWGVTEDVYESNVGEGDTITETVPSAHQVLYLTRISATLLYQPTSSRTYYGYFQGGSDPQITIQWVTNSSTTTGAGGGGGASGGPGGPGGNGSAPSGNTGGAGGVPASGGAYGGAGGNNGDNGSNGVFPGGGAGGGGYQSSTDPAGPNGSIVLTYSGTSAPPLLMSVALAAGTDQYGNSYPAGMMTGPLYSIQPGTTYTKEVWHYVGGTSALGTTFGSGWSNVGSPNAELAFKYISALNAVWIKGYVNNATASNTASIFTLPTGYRPASQQFFCWVEDPNSTITLKACLVTTAGVVEIAPGLSPEGSGNYLFDCFLSLDI